jgi:hypothetical protein
VRSAANSEFMGSDDKHNRHPSPPGSAGDIVARALAERNLAASCIGARNGFRIAQRREAKIGAIATSGAAETARALSRTYENARILGVIF